MQSSKMFRATRASTLAAAAAVLAAWAAPASAACFFVYGPKNELLYRSTTPPVDLSKPISQVVRARFRGGHLTMIPDEADCPDLAQYGPTDVPERTPRDGSPIEASPLFRNIESRTAIGNDAYVTNPKSPTGAAARR